MDQRPDDVQPVEKPDQSESNVTALPDNVLVFAKVQGEAMHQLPEDLYIPPEAMKVFLETFEGPLDLLLYLIKRQNIDVVDIPVAEITKQYTQYIEVMQELQLELAGEYLLMAAMLTEIKSRMLLPRPAEEEGEEHDPRAELVRRLLEYERFKQAAEYIEALPRMERDIHAGKAEVTLDVPPPPLPDITLKELLVSFQDILKRADMNAHHQIRREALSVRERMSNVLSTLEPTQYVKFTALFDPTEGRQGVVVTFLAILELIKNGLVLLSQPEPFAPIRVTAAGEALEASKGDDATTTSSPTLRVVSDNTSDE